MRGKGGMEARGEGCREGQGRGGEGDEMEMRGKRKDRRGKG